MKLPMEVPVSAIFEDSWIMLKGDQYVDPDGNDELFAEPLLVFEAHSGRPTAYDERKVYYIRMPKRPEFSGENAGRTMLVSPGDGARATLIYFPDDQHEVGVFRLGR